MEAAVHWAAGLIPRARDREPGLRVDEFSRGNGPAAAPPLAGSPEDLKTAAEPDSPRAHVQRLGREYGPQAPEKFMASVNNAVAV